MYKIKQMNKADLYCTKCLKVADDSTNVELKYGIDGINRPYSKWFSFLRIYNYWWRRFKLLLRRTKPKENCPIIYLKILMIN